MGGMVQCPGLRETPGSMFFYAHLAHPLQWVAVALSMSECARKASESNDDIVEKYLTGMKRKAERDWGIMRQRKVPQKLSKENMTKRM